MCILIQTDLLFMTCGLKRTGYFVDLSKIKAIMG